MQGGIISFMIESGGQNTVKIPSGAVTFYVSGSDGIKVYAGNSVAGDNAFIIMASSVGGNHTIENFVGGQYTFVEFGGRTIAVNIWCQGLEESL